MDWQIPLVVMATLFGAFLIFKSRPAFSTRKGAGPAALREAKARAFRATDDAERAAALCDVGDVLALSLGRGAAAVGYYLRAMRLQPASTEILARAAHGLARRPRALESLLWRRLGAEPWADATRPPAIEALHHLARLYAGPLKNAVRARAIEHAAEALERISPAAKTP